MNESSQAQPSIFLRVPIQWIIFSIQGIFLVIFNLIIVGAVVKYKQLRKKKEYLLFAALALSDALAGFGYFLVAYYLIWVVYTDQVGVKVSSWSCMLRPHNWFLGFGGPLSALMLTCVSIDRLICVARPTKYFKLRSPYAWKMIGFFYSAGAVSFTILLVTSYAQPHEPRHSMFCRTTDAIGHPWVKQYFLASRAIGGMTSVLIYLMIMPFFSRSQRMMYAENSIHTEQQIQRDVERQDKLSATVGICVFFTFVLFVLPNLAKYYVNTIALKDRPIAVVVLTGYASCIQNCNAILNIFFYALKLQDMRRYMKAFICCRGTNQVYIGSSQRAKYGKST